MSKKSSHSPRKSRDNRRGNKKGGHLIAVVVVLLVLAAVLLYTGYFSDNEHGVIQNTSINNEPFSMLENKDTSNLARIELENDLSILDISKKFYNNSAFWPYISIANKKINNPLEYNLLNLPKGTVINIPAVDSTFLNTTNAANMARIKAIGDSINITIQEKMKPKGADF